MNMSPLRIFTLNRHSGFVHTQALNWMDAPWLPKSDSGTRSPAPHLRHRGKVYSTSLAPFPTVLRPAPRPTLHPIRRECVIAARQAPEQVKGARVEIHRCVRCLGRSMSVPRILYHRRARSSRSRVWRGASKTLTNLCGAAQATGHRRGEGPEKRRSAPKGRQSGNQPGGNRTVVVEISRRATKPSGRTHRAFGQREQALCLAGNTNRYNRQRLQMTHGSISVYHSARRAACTN